MGRIKSGALAITAICLLFLCGPRAAIAQTHYEFRGLWAQAWASDLWTAQGISAIMSDLRAGNFNALIPQVRRRGDALYNSSYEPKCHNVSASFDPLADMIAKAHNPGLGRRIEVHAWLVTYHIWTASATYPKPPQPDHPLNLHPDWLLKDYTGNTLIANQYTFDPGHPEVQQHTFDVCMDIIRNYDVDGLNFDYIRYNNVTEGYNEVAVARFNKRFNRTGKPSPTDATWIQFRRDQVTALLRKVYLNALAIKPHVKISCDTITWAPGPTSEAGWYSSAAWSTVLQDWRGWMQEGIMDLNIPMAYFSQTAYARDYSNWSDFAKNHRFNRHVAIGPGIYLNTIQNSILQMRQTRQPSSQGNRADGVVGYAYQQIDNVQSPRSTFLSALVSPTTYDANPVPLFAEPAEPPPMLWKTASTNGHLMGYVQSGISKQRLDGALVTVTGVGSRTQRSDATGFYGFVDLAPGRYTVACSFAGQEPQTKDVSITAGVVSTMDLNLAVPQPEFSAIEALGSGDVRLKSTATPGNYAIEWSPNMTNWFLLTNVTSTSNGFEYLDADGTNQQRFYRSRRLP